MWNRDTIWSDLLPKVWYRNPMGPETTDTVKEIIKEVSKIKWHERLFVYFSAFFVLITFCLKECLNSPNSFIHKYWIYLFWIFLGIGMFFVIGEISYAIYLRLKPPTIIKPEIKE